MQFKYREELRQENHKYQDNLGCIARHYLKKHKYKINTYVKVLDRFL